ncbi:transposable element Tcb1 transposase [Trichonephila clavipes]|nr:transposable element Tcb1 transposase [Trichonephila clavipes]
MAVEEFEMKQIIESYENGEGNDLKPRSLVFRISKRINKTSTNKKELLSQSTSDNETTNSKKNLESSEQNSPAPSDSFNEYNADVKHLPRSETAEKTDNLENRFSIKMPKSVVEHTENKGPTLRRTSRRIIVKPANKEFLSESEMRKKNSEILKEKECNSEILKKGPNTGKMGKRKRGRKSFASALMQKIEPIRRGRGRPRTVNRDIPIHSTGKFVSLKGSKSIRKPPLAAKQRNDLTVWNLMPNECVDSEYFKSHIMKMQHGKPRGRKPKSTPILTLTPLSVGIPHMPLSNRENVEIRFPKMTPIAKKPVIHQNQEFHTAASSRPTVIYFKEPKNYTNCNPDGMEANQSIINQRNMSFDQQLVTPFKDFRNTVYLRRKYGNLIDDATFEYAYGRIVAFWDCGLSFREISQRAGRNSATIMQICHRWMQEVTTALWGRSYPPRRTTSRGDRWIMRIVVMDRVASSRTIAQQNQSVMHHSVSSRTIQRHLQQSGMSTGRPLLRIPLTENHRHLRCQWCNERRTWTTEWSGIVFTEESRFCLQHHDGQIRFWKHRDESLLSCCVIHRHTGLAPGIMI